MHSSLCFNYSLAEVIFIQSSLMAVVFFLCRVSEFSWKSRRGLWYMLFMLTLTAVL